MCVFKIQNTYSKLQTSEIALSRYISGNLVTIAKNCLALGSSDPLLKTMWTGSKEDQKWRHLIGWLNHMTSRHVTLKMFNILRKRGAFEAARCSEGRFSVCESCMKGGRRLKRHGA